MQFPPPKCVFQVGRGKSCSPWSLGISCGNGRVMLRFLSEGPQRTRSTPGNVGVFGLVDRAATWALLVITWNLQWVGKRLWNGFYPKEIPFRQIKVIYILDLKAGGSSEALLTMASNSSLRYIHLSQQQPGSLNRLGHPSPISGGPWWTDLFSLFSYCRLSLRAALMTLVARGTCLIVSIHSFYFFTQPHSPETKRAIAHCQNAQCPVRLWYICINVYVFVCLNW